MTAQTPMLAFNAGFSDEKMKGNPKCIRTERRDFQPGACDASAGTLCLQEVTECTPDGRPAERTVYRPDGTVSYRFVYQYAKDTQFTTVKTFDASGKEVQTIRNVRLNDTETEEVVVNSDGEKVTRTVSKLDEAGHVLESTLTDLSANLQVHQSQRYDAQGRFNGGEVTFHGMEHDFPSRMEIVPQGDNRSVTTCYASDGTILMQSEAKQGEAVRECSLVLFDGKNAYRRITVEKIDSIDAQGNWTKKGIFEYHDQEAEPSRPVSEVYRTITYYS